VDSAATISPAGRNPQRGADRRPAGQALQVLSEEELERDVAAEQGDRPDVGPAQRAGAEYPEWHQRVPAAALHQDEDGDGRGDEGK